MSWINKKPTFGDHIRVSRGLYSHHGIYASDDCIIHFASNEVGHETDPEYASICITDLASFQKEGSIEVREFSQEELLVKRSPQDTINYAFTKLGEKGYDLINNNCEHFANLCLFDKKVSSQVDNIKDFFANLFR